MNFPDVKTVLFTMLGTDILCTLVLVQLWRQSRERFEGTGFWAVDYVCQTAALVLILLRGIAPDWMSMVLSNTLAVTAALVGYMGLERFVGRRGTQIHNYCLLCVFVFVHGYCSLVQPDLWMRSINISAALLIICLQCAWLVFVRVGPQMRSLAGGVGFVFVALCLVNTVRILGLLGASDRGQDYFHSSAPEAIVPVLYLLLLILLTYSLSLMVNKRLLLDIKSEEEKFSRAFHCSPYAIALTHLSDGRIIEANEAFADMTGFSRTEFLGQTTLDISIWRSKENRDVMVDALSKGGSVKNIEVRFRTRGGEAKTGLVSADRLTINGEECILSSVVDITDRKRSEEERDRLISELREAVSKIRTLSGLLPICSSCKKIRDDKGYWRQIESYIQEHSEAEFTHGICPACARKLYPELADKLKAGDE